jgi:hypothetical protein
MQIIFKDGEQLHNAQNKLDINADLIAKIYGIKLYQYQKDIINKMVNDNKPTHSIYGDDFRIDIIKNNIAGDCVLSINDYDENHEFESNIVMDFTNEELDQLINLLKTVREERR